MSKYQVLLVDDNPVVRRIVREVLEKEADLRICGEADDGIEALDKAKLLQPDVVVLDFSMPRMSGLEAAPHLRSIREPRMLPNSSVAPISDNSQ